MTPFKQTFLLVRSLQTEVAVGQRIDYVLDVFGTERCWGGARRKNSVMTVQNHAPNTDFH